MKFFIYTVRFLKIQVRKSNEIFGRDGVLANDFFHPDHVVPLAIFVTAFCKMCGLLIAKAFVKQDAFWIRIGDAGV